MLNFLIRHNKNSVIQGIGLSANQIGEQVQVCVLLFSTPLTLVNPNIIKSSGVIEWTEGCLSFPNRVVRTYRYREITVRADNLWKPITFGCYGDYTQPVESVAVQHEIDHLQSKLMFDRIYPLTESYEGFRLGMSNANPGE